MKIEFQIHVRPENQAMGGPAKVEHSDLIALADILAFVRSDLARGNLGHTYGQYAH